MPEILNITEDEKKEILEITQILSSVPPGMRATVNGFLMKAEYSEQSFKESENKSC